MYGTSPIKLIITRRKKIAESVVDMPFRWRPEVRVNWAKIVFFTGALILDDRDLIVQKDDWIIKITKVLVTRNKEFEGKRVLNIKGSKDEKMSGIMARLEIAHLKL